MTTERIHYMHIELGSRGGKATLAFTCHKEGEQEIATVGIAFCSPRDQFNKAKGRQIASARLLHGRDTKLRICCVVRGPDRFRDDIRWNFLNLMASSDAKANHVPRWARKGSAAEIKDNFYL
jgi:hypothetical protein